MSEILTLNAELRERVGKGSARAARRELRVPAVIYGDKKAPVSITVAHNELMKIINRGHFLSQSLDVIVGKRKERVLPRDIQLHPVTDWPVHVDFFRLASDAVINIAVPVTFINHEDSPGLKRGAVLNVVRHDVELICPADAIPNELVIDVTGLDVGATIHFSSVTLPEGVKPVIQDRDFTIATIAAPSGLKSEEAAEAAAGGEEPAAEAEKA